MHKLILTYENDHFIFFPCMFLPYKFLWTSSTFWFEYKKVIDKVHS